MLPQIGLIFLLLNTSIFAIDGVISLSNAMIHALNLVFPTSSLWDSLSSVVDQSGGLGIAALIIMVFFLVFSVALLIYYIGRLVTLYVGAVLAPLVCLLWLLPTFKDFAETAAKLYLSVIFVLFVHVVILDLAASMFAGLSLRGSDHTADPIMALVLGVATIMALLKTQRILTQLSFMSSGPRTARQLATQFGNGLSSLSLTNSRHTGLAGSRQDAIRGSSSAPTVARLTAPNTSSFIEQTRSGSAESRLSSPGAKRSGTAPRPAVVTKSSNHTHRSTALPSPKKGAFAS